MKALVTGASGYVGQFLCKSLLAKHFDVYATYFRNPSSLNFAASHLTSQVDAPSTHQPDIRNIDAIQNLLQTARPDLIYHLSYDPQDLTGTVVQRTENLLRGRNEITPTVRIVFLSI